MLRFDGLVAIVTGAGRGMGRAHAMLLASRGCKVVVNDLGVKSTGMASDQDPAADVVREIESAGGIATADRHNVATEAAQIIETAIAKYGRLDIVINNAGVLNDGLFAGTPAAQWEAAFNVHLKGTVDVCRAAWPYLLNSDAARIVNTSSSATFGCFGITSYSAAKGATFSFTRSLAEEGRRVGINVNAIMPTAWTRMTSTFDDPNVLEALETHFQPERVSAFVAWLVHPSTDIWRETFRVSGFGASRVNTTTTPSTIVDQSTPEAWVAMQQSLMSEITLIPMPTTIDSLVRELKEANPDIDTSHIYSEGGTVSTSGKGGV